MTKVLKMSVVGMKMKNNDSLLSTATSDVLSKIIFIFEQRPRCV